MWFLARKSMTIWSGRPGSNRRRPAWEAGILPLNYSRPGSTSQIYDTTEVVVHSLVGQREKADSQTGWDQRPGGEEGNGGLAEQDQAAACPYAGGFAGNICSSAPVSSKRAARPSLATASNDPARSGPFVAPTRSLLYGLANSTTALRTARRRAARPDPNFRAAHPAGAGLPSCSFSSFR